jgi:hypothetical protein
MNIILHIIVFLSLYNNFMAVADEKVQTSNARWWDCVFKRPAAEFQLNTAQMTTLPAISVAFAVEDPNMATDELGDPKQYRPKFSGGVVNLTVAPDKIAITVREDLLGPVNWPYTYKTEASIWSGKKPIEFSFDREILKGVARYQLNCLARK